MNPTQSPWLAQLKHERPHFHVERDSEADVAIIGAGIAGISTAYFLLRYTKLRVILVEAGRIAHGATGHNAGQVVSYFERPFPELVKSYGLSMAAHGQHDIESAWYLLEQMIHDAKLNTPFYRCTGYSGLSTLPQILEHLEENALRAKAGLKIEPILIKAGCALANDIPKEYEAFWSFLPHSSILRLLETEDTRYIAAIASQKGCINSALLCEELAGALVATYGDRFTIAEHLPVRTLVLSAKGGVLRTDGPNISAAKVVLCTNGFENVTIEHIDGPPINRSFHTMVQGVIGYMSGYFEEFSKPPAAISYYRSTNSHLDAYAYFTRRPFEHAGNPDRNLICMGGPERLLPDMATYDPSAPFPADVDEELDVSLRATYNGHIDASKRAFLWHGLMGYTPSGVRCIGADPRNDALLYNLGCNGVGILPSVYGAKRICQILSGFHLPESMFDPAMVMRSSN